MARLVFRSDAWQSDKAVEVGEEVIGRRTLLSVAQSSRVPLKFSCTKGDCGACAVQISVTSEGILPLAGHLTKKEKLTLNLAGKLRKAHILAAENNNVVPPWRLACQYVVRSEDLLVEV